MKNYTNLLIIVLLFLSCQYVSANNLTVSEKSLNTISTYNKMVDYSENNFKYNIYAVDTHTAGEPTRIVISGLPEIKGSTMMERKEYFQNNFDFLRKSLMDEPRGHRDMFGALITTPVTKNADFGVIFIEGSGYLNMCGHGTIGVITMAVETGLIKLGKPLTEVKIDTPAGLVTGMAKMNRKLVEEVTIKNVPSFLYKKNVAIEFPKIGKITVDIAYGGSFFALVDESEISIPIEYKNIDKLIKIGIKIRDKINQTVKVKHPTLNITRVDLVEIYKHIGNRRFKNIVIFGEGQFDRSPCGTGTSAKLAALYAKGEIKEGQIFINESIMGSTFKGKIVGLTKVGSYEAVIPEITGKALITGFNHYVIDPNDPFKYGFTIE